MNLCNHLLSSIFMHETGSIYCSFLTILAQHPKAGCTPFSSDLPHDDFIPQETPLQFTV